MTHNTQEQHIINVPRGILSALRCLSTECAYAIAFWCCRLECRSTQQCMVWSVKRFNHMHDLKEQVCTSIIGEAHYRPRHQKDARLSADAAMHSGMPNQNWWAQWLPMTHRCQPCALLNENTTAIKAKHYQKGAADAYYSSVTIFLLNWPTL